MRATLHGGPQDGATIRVNPTTVFLHVPSPLTPIDIQDLLPASFSSPAFVHSYRRRDRRSLDFDYEGIDRILEPSTRGP